MFQPKNYFHGVLYSLISLACLFPTVETCFGQEKQVSFSKETNISYRPDEIQQTADEYQKSQCRLDLYWPENTTGYTTVIWFHGGGLTGGQRHIPEAMRKTRHWREGKLALAIVSYRLSPQVPYPVFIEDAAAAVAWILQNIQNYGGDPEAVFVSGGSAGGYLTAMVGMDPRWLKPYNIQRTELAGLIPVSGQMTTHFHVKKLLNIPGDQYQPVIDENAPLAHLSANEIPPLLLILGDRQKEWKARVEENELMAASLRAMGHPLIYFSENPGWGHEISSMSADLPQETVDLIDTFIDQACALKK